MGDSANLHASHSSGRSVHQHMTDTKIGEAIRSILHAVNSEGSDWEGVNQIDEEGVKLYDSGESRSSVISEQRYCAQRYRGYQVFPERRAKRSYWTPSMISGNTKALRVFV